MTVRYQITSPDTASEILSPEHIGAMVTILFYDGSGAPVTPVGLPVIERSAYAFGGNWHPVEPFNYNEWRFNAYAQRVRVNLAGVTGFASYVVEVFRTAEPLSMIPDGAFTGVRAMISQPYDEMNKKRGVQWEASTRFQLAGGTGVNFTVFRTGSKTVDLKQRVLGFDGAGVIGRLYRDPVFTDGTVAGFWNMLTSEALTQPECQIIAAPSVNDRGVEIAAPIYAFGAASQQGKGVAPAAYATNRIFDEPNTTYLLVIETLDPQSQFVSSRVEIYEGDLDWPL